MKFFWIFTFALFISLDLYSQIPVHDEPLHHVIYEDAEIRILEIIVLPGDTALMHQHDYNYCYLARQGGRMWLEDLGKDSREVNLPTHYAGGKFELAQGPFVHCFANIDTSQISFFTIEHKTGEASRMLPDSLPQDNILESPLFTIRKVKIEPLSSLNIPHEGTAVLLNLSPSPLLLSGIDSLTYWRRFDTQEVIHVSNMHKELKSVAVYEIY